MFLAFVKKILISIILYNYIRISFQGFKCVNCEQIVLKVDILSHRCTPAPDLIGTPTKASTPKMAKLDSKVRINNMSGFYNNCAFVAYRRTVCSLKLTYKMRVTVLKQERILTFEVCIRIHRADNFIWYILVVRIFSRPILSILLVYTNTHNS